MTSANSLGYGMSVDVDALTIVGLDVGPLPTGVQGTAPAPYSESDTVVNVNVATSVPLVASGTATAGSVFGTADSNVDGLPGTRLTTAAGGVVNANIGAITLPVVGSGVNLLGIDATLSSSAQVSGDFGSFLATGTTTIEDLALTINAIPVDLSAFVNTTVAPNTSVDLSALGIVGATLVLNEQLVAPDQSSIVVNAFRLSLNLAGVVGGEVILGHSEAQMAGVPEPTTWALGAMGALGVVGVRRRSRHAA